MKTLFNTENEGSIWLPEAINALIIIKIHFANISISSLEKQLIEYKLKYIFREFEREKLVLSSFSIRIQFIYYQIG